MRVGLYGLGGRAGSTIDAQLAAVRQAADEGFASYWLPQVFGLDALTTLAIVGRQVEGIQLGTAVVPIYGRHPMALAIQALTANQSCGGRLQLGVGLSHQVVVEGMWGLSFDRPATHMREYLSALGPLLSDGQASFSGDTVTVHGQIRVPDAGGLPLLVAALGPRMLRIAGELADGTITWMTGPRTLSDHVVPTIREAAESAGRPSPRIVAGLPVCVTDDPQAAMERGADVFKVYGDLPSYRAMLDREGAAGPADVAIVGDEETVAGQIAELAEIGVTDFIAVEYAKEPGERDRTRAALHTVLATQA
jgi:F420-dependent oxidoreductase-like protein